MVRLICLRLLRIRCHDDFSVELHDSMTCRNTVEQLVRRAGRHPVAHLRADADLLVPAAKIQPGHIHISVLAYDIDRQRQVNARSGHDDHDNVHLRPGSDNDVRERKF